MLYESDSNSRLPCLYICSVAKVLGRTSLIPFFIRQRLEPCTSRALGQPLLASLICPVYISQ